MRARACCDAGSIGRFLRSIIAVMDDVRWRPEDFIVMVVVCLFQRCAAFSFAKATTGEGTFLRDTRNDQRCCRAYVRFL